MTDSILPVEWAQDARGAWSCHLGRVVWSGHRGGYLVVPRNPDALPPNRPTAFATVAEAKAAIEALAQPEQPRRDARGRWRARR